MYKPFLDNLKQVENEGIVRVRNLTYSGMCRGMDIEVVLVVVLLSAGLLAAFIYFLFTSKLQALQEVVTSANKLEGTVNAIQNLSSGFLEHLNSMRTMQENLDGRVSKFLTSCQ